MLSFFSFDWRIMALQYCIGFCCTTTPFSHRYIYIYPFLLRFPLESILFPLGHHRAGLPVLHSSFLLVIYLTHGSVYTSMLFSQFVLASPSPAVSLHLCLHFFSVNRFICTIFLDSLCTC